MQHGVGASSISWLVHGRTVGEGVHCAQQGELATSSLQEVHREANRPRLGAWRRVKGISLRSSALSGHRHQTRTGSLP